MKNSSTRLMKGILLCMGGMFILFGSLRSFLGADLYDEALYIGDPFIVAHGSTPYVNNWLQTPGFSFFLAPVVALYEVFVPTHQGIFLFMRLFFLVAKILMYVGICILFRKSKYKYAVRLITLPLIANFYGMIPAFNYTNIPLIGTFLAGMLVLYQWNYQRHEKIFPVISGILLACSTLCSPTQILNCLLFCVFYFIFVDKKSCVRYVLGGLASALMFSLYMMIKAGSLTNLIYSFETLLKHPYFSFGHSTLSWQAYQIFPMAIGSVLLYFVCALIMELFRRCTGKKNSLIWSCKMGLITGAFVGLIYNFIRYEQYPLWNRVIILLSIGAFFFRCLPSDRAIHKLFDFVAIPEMVTFLGMALTVYGGAAGRFYVFVPMALICLAYIYNALSEYWDERCIYLTAIYVGMFAAVMIKYEFHTIYGEFTEDSRFLAPTELTCRVDEGIYAGLYTTPEKAEAVQELEEYLRLNTSRDEYVLFLDRVPMAYLMTDAQPCTSTSWDPQLYSEDYRGETKMLEDYFDTVQRVPDKVIYIQTRETEKISIEQNDYKFNDYINQNYSLQDTSKIGNSYRVIIYKRK